MPCQTDRGDYSAAPPYRLMAPRNQENGSPRRVSQCPGFARRARRYGGVAEWLKAHAWKACLRETVTWVRIPPPPPRSATPCGSAFFRGSSKFVGRHAVDARAYAGLIGLDAPAYGAHSLPNGFLTSAVRRGASVFKIRDVSRHRSMDVLSAHVRDADLFRDHAGAELL
jgi:hypothetical protein